MHKACKGKVCIISIPEFKHLRPLKGYVKDTENLTELWVAMGFEVFLPVHHTGQPYPTAKVCTSVVGCIYYGFSIVFSMDLCEVLLTPNSI